MVWLPLLLTLQQALWQALWLDVPFIRQDKNGCGSASIWMVMKYWQPDAELDVQAVQKQLYSEQAGGIFAKDMARYFESRGYRVFAFRGEWADLENHISKGRPLVVSLERSNRGVPIHYVVVAGIDSVENIVLINDPAQRKLMSMSRSDFERDWRAADNWTLLAVPELDLAGNAFREERLPEARGHLTAALRVNPSDAYANDFLATVYFLQNNTEAAVKYWNRAGKPEIENIRFDPPLRTDSVLLDRALALSRGTILRSSDLETAEARLDAIRIFSRYRLELTPAEGERFDLTIRAAEKSPLNVWSWGRGLPYQTIQPELSNINGKAVHLGSMFRWDRNKRRVLAYVDSPIKNNPKWAVHAGVDARDENWAGDRDGFRMKKIEIMGELRSTPSGRWHWTTGAGVSKRRFSNELSGGTALKYAGSITRTLIRDPAEGLRLDSSLKIEAGRVFGANTLRFAKLIHTTSVRWRSFHSELHAGTVAGETPFDERFTIGLDRDSDLWLRAHRATIHGRKNSSNTTRRFVVSNTDFQTPIFSTGWFGATGGPFLDAAKSSLSSRWIADAGVEVRFSVLASLGIRLSYGKSLTDGMHALFIR